MSDICLSRWLWLLLPAPVLAILNLTLFPRRPQAAPLPPPPQTAGGTWQLVEEQSYRRERDLDLSPSRTYMFEVPNLGERPVADLQLNLTSVAVRTTPAFQVAAITATIPSLQLRDRRLLPNAEDGQLAIGHIAERPTWQTCILPNGRSAVTGDALRIGLRAQRELDTTTLAKLSRLLGIRDHPGHKCLLVTISGIDSSSTPAVHATLQPFVEEVIRGLASS